MSLLTCRHLSVSYDGKAVLSDLNFSVDEGDYLGIVGENGAGKSTLVKALLRLKKISGGEIVTADGFKPTEIGYLPQQTPVQKDFPASVWEVVLSGRLNRCGMYPFYRKSDKEDAEEKNGNARHHRPEETVLPRSFRRPAAACTPCAGTLRHGKTPAPGRAGDRP